MQVWFNGRTPAFQAGYVGSIPITRFDIAKGNIYHGILAQLVEHLTFNQVVGGSNPPCLIIWWV